MRLTGIYKIQSIKNPNRIYIGSSINVLMRWNDHAKHLRRNAHHSIKLQRHYNKYGSDDLRFTILYLCKESELTEAEQYFIDTYKPYFNCCPVAGSQKNRVVSEETKEKIRKANLGKKHSEDTKRKISLLLMGNKYTAGYKQSEESNIKRSLKLKGRKLPEEQKKKIGEANKGRFYSKESRRKMSEAAKRAWVIRKQVA